MKFIKVQSRVVPQQHRTIIVATLAEYIEVNSPNSADSFHTDCSGCTSSLIVNLTPQKANIDYGVS